MSPLTAALADEVITIEPWSPWPLAFPAVIAFVGVLASLVGTRFHSKTMRESGYVAFLVGVLAAAMMTWSLSGMWDSGRRADALTDLGYQSPTFSGSLNLAGDRLAPIAWQAVRNGERVRGVLRPLGDDRWEIAELEPRAE